MAMYNIGKLTRGKKTLRIYLYRGRPSRSIDLGGVFDFTQSFIYPVQSMLNPELDSLSRQLITSLSQHFVAFTDSDRVTRNLLVLNP